MQIQEEFSLESILSIITGRKFVNDFNEIYELYWFMFEDPFINATGICYLKDKASKHILNIHPELKNVSFKNGTDVNKWLDEQRQKFGNTLLISIVGEPIIVTEKQPMLR